MYITTVKLQNFRNYENEIINLDKNINIFYGENAQGKTNILEAVFIAAMGKSFRAKKDKELIKFNENNCSIEINFIRNSLEKITVPKIINLDISQEYLLNKLHNEGIDIDYV